MPAIFFKHFSQKVYISAERGDFVLSYMCSANYFNDVVSNYRHFIENLLNFNVKIHERKKIIFFNQDQHC